jgi:RimJ/RimL family protein N-acetyltransferase
VSVQIDTARLILRPPRAEDFDAWVLFSADAATTEFLGGPQPRASAWRAFTLMAGAWALYGFGMFSVLERSTGRWIGRVGPWCPDGWPGTEIGWGLHREAWGRGYAFEAACAATDWAFDTLGWTSIIHCIAAANGRSIRLAERLGSRHQRRTMLPAPIGVEVEVYGQDAVAWRSSAAQRRGGVPR